MWRPEPWVNPRETGPRPTLVSVYHLGTLVRSVRERKGHRRRNTDRLPMGCYHPFVLRYNVALIKRTPSCLMCPLSPIDSSGRAYGSACASHGSWCNRKGGGALFVRPLSRCARVRTAGTLHPGLSRRGPRRPLHRTPRSRHNARDRLRFWKEKRRSSRHGLMAHPCHPHRGARVRSLRACLARLTFCDSCPPGVRPSRICGLQASHGRSAPCGVRVLT